MQLLIISLLTITKDSPENHSRYPLGALQCHLLDPTRRWIPEKERDATFDFRSCSQAVKYLSWMAELRAASGLSAGIQQASAGSGTNISRQGNIGAGTDR